MGNRSSPAGLGRPANRLAGPVVGCRLSGGGFTPSRREGILLANWVAVQEKAIEGIGPAPDRIARLVDAGGAEGDVLQPAIAVGPSQLPHGFAVENRLQ